MTVIEHVDDLEELLNKAKTDVRWFIRDFQFRFEDTLQLEITSLGEDGQILMYRKYREERMEEPPMEHNATMNLRWQREKLESLLRREKKKFRFFRNTEAIDAYEDDLKKIKLEIEDICRFNKGHWEIYKLQRKEEKKKLKQFALAIPNIKKGCYEAK